MNKQTTLDKSMGEDFLTIFRSKSLPVREEARSTVVKESSKSDPGIPVGCEVSDLAVR